MTFDNGRTEILLSDGKKEKSDKGSNPSSENLRTTRVQNRLLTKIRQRGSNHNNLIL
jgi:hypothetical protein